MIGRSVYGVWRVKVKPQPTASESCCLCGVLGRGAVVVVSSRLVLYRRRLLWSRSRRRTMMTTSFMGFRMWSSRIYTREGFSQSVGCIVHSAPEESFGETVELPYPSGLLLRLLLLPRFVLSWVFLLLSLLLL